METPLENASAHEALSWVFETFGERTALSTAFGPGGIVLMHLASQVKPGAKVFFIDTGFHFDETLDMIHRIQARMAVDIEVIEPTLSRERQALVHGDALHVLDPDRCCELRKIEPTKRMLTRLDAWVTALRRDQGPTRANLPVVDDREVDGRRLVKVNPLVTWTRKEVWRHIHAHNLPYNPLHDRGYPSVGCQPCTRPSRNSADERAGRWAGRNKTECGMHTQL